MIQTQERERERETSAFILHLLKVKSRHSKDGAMQRLALPRLKLSFSMHTGIQTDRK